MRQGKVRDIFDLGDKLLLISTDRVSCFDVILKSEIPSKGKILNGISSFWFRFFDDIENHFISSDHKDFPPHFKGDYYKERSMLVKKMTPIRIECVVRKSVRDKEGSLWRELDEEIFTPAIKNDVGHDENVDFEKLKESAGEYLAQQLKEKSISIFRRGASFLRKKGITLLDSKFEFGEKDGAISLIDEVFTPDSSRFLDEKGRHLDKEFLRGFLKKNSWSLTEALPEEVIKEVKKRYEEVEKRILS